MSEYRIFETDEFRKSLTKLDSREAEYLRKKLRSHVYAQLRQMPFFGPNIKKLQGYDPETWRYRIGRFRVFYLVQEKDRIVFLLTVDRRKDAYR